MSLRRSLRFLAAALFAAAIVSCKSTHPSGTPVATIPSSTPEQTAQQLRALRASFHGMKSLMHVRATTGGKTQSFRAQLIVHDARRMELIAYTPVGTTALTMKADGDAITTDPAVAPESFAFLRAAGLTPAETGMLLLGIPPRDDVRVTYGAGGLSSANAGEIAVTFEPPAFPAKRIVIARGDDRIELEHLEVVSE